MLFFSLYTVRNTARFFVCFFHVNEVLVYALTLMYIFVSFVEKKRVRYIF